MLVFLSRTIQSTENGRPSLTQPESGREKNMESGPFRLNTWLPVSRMRTDHHQPCTFVKAVLWFVSIGVEIVIIYVRLGRQSSL